MKISWYTDSPRARTHAGRLSCIDAFSVDSDSSHDAPPTTSAAITTPNTGTNASTAVAAEKPTAPAVSRTFAPKRDRSRDSTSAPSSAPTPRAPSSSPYPAEDNCSRSAAITGSNPHSALAGR